MYPLSFVSNSFETSYLFSWWWHIAITKAIEGEFHGIPNFVAEVSIANHTLHIQVDVSSLSCVGTQCKPHGIRTTLRDPFRIVSFLEGQERKGEREE